MQGLSFRHNIILNIRIRSILHGLIFESVYIFAFGRKTARKTSSTDGRQVANRVGHFDLKPD